LPHDIRRAGRLQHRGVGGLILIQRMWQRHQDRGAPDRRDFRHGGGARARDHQLRSRDAQRQIGKERRDVRLHAGALIDFGDPRDVFGPRLLRHDYPVAGFRRQGGHGSGNNIRHHARALGAAGDEKPQLAVELGIGLIDRRERVGPQRIAGDGDLGAQGGRRVRKRKTRRYRVNPPRQKAVGLAHHAIGFMQDGRDTQKRRRDKRRHGRIAAKADHDPRTKPQEQRQRLGHAETEPRHRGYAREKRPAARRSRADRVHRARGKAVPIAQRALVRHKFDRDAALRENMGESLGGEEMPPGAAGGE